VESAAVVACGLALAWRKSVDVPCAIHIGSLLTKVVRLHLVGVRAEPLPVDLVQVIGLQDKTADNAGARCCLSAYLDLAEHDVPLRCELGRVAGLPDGERDAI
jgi:hypothetical protein